MARTKKAVAAPEPVSTVEDQKPEHLFRPGQSGNPNGRPKGSRNKLGEAFVAALHEDFGKNGVEVIERVRATDPAAYMRVIASLLPKELKIETKADLNDEQLDARIRQLANLFGIEVGAGGASGGAPAPQGPRTTH